YVYLCYDRTGQVSGASQGCRQRKGCVRHGRGRNCTAVSEGGSRRRDSSASGPSAAIVGHPPVRSDGTRTAPTGENAGDRITVGNTSHLSRHQITVCRGFLPPYLRT